MPRRSPANHSTDAMYLAKASGGAAPWLRLSRLRYLPAFSALMRRMAALWDRSSASSMPMRPDTA